MFKLTNFKGAKIRYVFAIVPGDNSIFETG